MPRVFLAERIIPQENTFVGDERCAPAAVCWSASQVVFVRLKERGILFPCVTQNIHEFLVGRFAYSWKSPWKSGGI